MFEETLLVEKYRPKTIDECILPDSIKDTFKGFIKEKHLPNLMLSGSSGCGKTTVARAVASELNYDSIIVNCGLDMDKAALRGRISEFASSISFDRQKKMIILDESDQLNATHVQPALRYFIEEFSENCSFIFTCNYPRKILPAIHSRCSLIHFDSFINNSEILQKEFAKRVIYILKEENIKFDKSHIPIILSLIKKFFPDFRRVLNEIQRYTTSGRFDEGILVNIADIDCEHLVKLMKEKNFDKVRTWVALNAATETEVYRMIYDNLKTFVDGDSIPQAILTLAEYQYKAAFVVDSEINLMAALLELMSDIEWK